MHTVSPCRSRKEGLCAHPRRVPFGFRTRMSIIRRQPYRSMTDRLQKTARILQKESGLSPSSSKSSPKSCKFIRESGSWNVTCQDFIEQKCAEILQTPCKPASAVRPKPSRKMREKMAGPCKSAPAVRPKPYSASPKVSCRTLRYFESSSLSPYSSGDIRPPMKLGDGPT